MRVSSRRPGSCFTPGCERYDGTATLGSTASRRVQIPFEGASGRARATRQSYGSVPQARSHCVLRRKRAVDTSRSTAPPAMSASIQSAFNDADPPTCARPLPGGRVRPDSNSADPSRIRTGSTYSPQSFPSQLPKRIARSSAIVRQLNLHHPAGQPARPSAAVRTRLLGRATQPFDALGNKVVVAVFR